MADIPHRIRKRVAELRTAVNTVAHAAGATSFGPVFDLFMSLAEERAFTALGEADNPDYLVPTLEVLAKAQVVTPPAAVAVLGAVRIPELGMRHGAVLFNGRPGVYFGFDDERAMFGWQRGDGQFQMTRITITPSAPGELPEVLGPTVKGLH